MKNSPVWDPKLFKEHYESTTKGNRTSAPSEQRKLDFYFKELDLKNTDVLLDAGCGYGRLSVLVKDKVMKIIGIDINPENIKYAKEYVGSKFEGHVVDLSSGALPFPDKSIDKIAVDNVLMFLNEKAQIGFFKEAKRVLKENGVIVFNFENSDYFLMSFSDIFTAMYKMKAKLLGRVTPFHFQYSLSFYEKILSELGFGTIRSIGDTFYRKMGIGVVEILPAFLHSYIAKQDNSNFNKEKKRKMASITVAASIK